MASTIPAELLGREDLGAIAPGRRADLVALDPDTLAVRAVWKHGERIT
jgi:N-acetylglucosamine-6-phosphate deacetylase